MATKDITSSRFLGKNFLPISNFQVKIDIFLTFVSCIIEIFWSMMHLKCAAHMTVMLHSDVILISIVVQQAIEENERMKTSS